MSELTPTTADIKRGLLTGYVSDSEFDRWLADVKAKAWEEGAVWQRANSVPEDRRMKARFVSELQAVNPYRNGEK